MRTSLFYGKEKRNTVAIVVSLQDDEDVLKERNQSERIINQR